MGKFFLIQGGNKTRMTQIPITKFMDISPAEIVRIGTKMGVDWKTIDQKQLIEGATEEANEHPKVATDAAKAIQIALDHLKEMPDYYTRLKEMESGEKVVKGGPGSGRYPAGSGREKEAGSGGKEVLDYRTYNPDRTINPPIKGKLNPFKGSPTTPDSIKGFHQQMKDKGFSHRVDRASNFTSHEYRKPIDQYHSEVYRVMTNPDSTTVGELRHFFQHEVNGLIPKNYRINEGK